MSSTRSRNYSRGRKPSDLTCSRVEQHARARVERRACRAHVINHDHNASRYVDASSQGERVSDVRMTLGGGKIGLRHGRTDSFQRLDGRNRKMPANLARLIEAARALPRSMKGNRNGDVGAGEGLGPVLGQQPRQRPGKGSTSVIFQRVNDRSKGPVVLTYRASSGNQVLSIAAARAAVRLEADGAPGCQRIATHVAERRNQEGNRLPAGLTDRSTRRRVERPLARRAHGGQQNGEERVGNLPPRRVLPPRGGSYKIAYAPSVTSIRSASPQRRSSE